MGAFLFETSSFPLLPCACSFVWRGWHDATSTHSAHLASLPAGFLQLLQFRGVDPTSGRVYPSKFESNMLLSPQGLLWTADRNCSRPPEAWSSILSAPDLCSLSLC